MESRFIIKLMSKVFVSKFTIITNEILSLSRITRNSFTNDMQNIKITFCVVKIIQGNDWPDIILGRELCALGW